MRRVRTAIVVGLVAGGSVFSVGVSADAKSKRCKRGYVKRHGKCVKVHRKQHQRQGA